MIASFISRTSAALLLAVGLALLFASDAILPAVLPSIPAGAAWFGQLLGAALLAMATLNWLSRSLLIGGIYGRPVVAANAVLYFVAAMVLIRPAMHPGSSAPPALLLVPIAAFAIAYGWLLFRGPFARDLEISRRG